MSRLGPVQAMRAVRAVLQDPELTNAVKNVVVSIIASASYRTGRTRASYRWLSSKFRLSATTVNRALAKDGPVIGRYLNLVGRGKSGVSEFEVIPAEALCTAERSARKSAALRPV